jgi:hypothetical protein
LSKRDYTHNVSRGIGRLQSEILTQLSASAAPTTLESLRWCLWERSSTIPSSLPEQNVSLPRAWNTSIQRAALSLSSPRHAKLVIERRRLSTIEEFLTHFPNKTLIARTRYLRFTLLPPLFDPKTHDIHPLFSKSKNEEYYLKKTRRAAIPEASELWQSIETKLIQLMSKATGVRRSRIFLLVSKARELFLREHVRTIGAFTDHVDEVIGRSELTPELRESLVRVRDLVLPRTEEKQLDIKSRIYSLVSIKSKGAGSELKSKSLESLLAAKPDILDKLNVMKEDLRLPFGEKLYKYSCNELDTLIDTSALQCFRFLQIV